MGDPLPTGNAVPSGTAVTTESRPQVVRAPRLSKLGLTAAIVGMIASPVALVIVSFTLFPEIVSEPLPVSISMVGYRSPEEVQRSIEASQRSGTSVIEPYLSVKNEADFPISSVYVTLNRRFVFHTDRPLQPGESRNFYLSRFQEPDGSPFWPHRYDIQRVIVRGRLPNLKQAIHEKTWEELLAGDQGGAGQAETAEEGSSNPSPEEGESGM